MTSESSQFRNHSSAQEIIDVVRQRFRVTSEYLREDTSVEFHLDPVQENVKSNFLSLIEILRKSGETAVLRRTVGGYFLVVGRKQLPERRKSKTPIILLIATIVTILITGFVQAYYAPHPLSPPLSASAVAWDGFLFFLAIFGIIAIHEMGHKLASWYHKMDSSWPYFLPGIPGIWPTMGAVITTRDPPVNRDSLFDLGISGPLAGLAVTIIVSIPAVLSARLVPISSFPSTQSLGSSDLYTNLLVGFFKAPQTSDVIVGSLFSILYFAYSFGFLLTFINLLPAWQLDGGHIMNAAVSQRVHKWLTYASVVVMLLIGFYLMAILIFFFAGRSPSLQPLDNVSPLSPRRRAIFWLTWALAALIFALVLYNNAFFGIVPI